MSQARWQHHAKSARFDTHRHTSTSRLFLPGLLNQKKLNIFSHSFLAHVLRWLFNKDRLRRWKE